MLNEGRLSDEERARLLRIRDQLREEIALRGESVLARVQLADIHTQLREREETIESLRIALRLKPDALAVISRLKQICTEEELANLETPEEVKRSKSRLVNFLRGRFREDFGFSFDPISYLRAGAVVIVAIHFFWISRKIGWHFLDNVNLVIHEIGHPVFGAFGEFIGMAGGTIMQLIVPLGLILYFLFTKRLFSASLLIFWLGESFLNVSVYAADAVKMKLLLVGGNIHDWHYMFSRLNVLHKTDQIAGAIRNTGIALMVVATIAGLFTSFYRITNRSYKE